MASSPEQMSESAEGTGSETLSYEYDLVPDHNQAMSSSVSNGDKPTMLLNRRLFGRQNPVHTVLGGGKPADIILWRNKQISAAVLVGVTAIWLLFEWLGYHFLTLVCHTLMISLGILFCWSNISAAVQRSAPNFPEIVLPEDLFVSVALSARYEMNRALATFREVTSGKSLKKFFMMIASLWVLSVVGSWFSFLTLVYIVFLILHSVPALYEKHEDYVDNFADKAMDEINKQYKVLDEKVLQKIPKVPIGTKKLQ